jgi:predicted nucleic acid-binding protein
MSTRLQVVLDDEELLEILHRFLAIGRPEAIDPCLDTLRGVVDDIFAVTADDVLTARALLGAVPGLSARDAVHAAVMHRHGVRRILTFDQGFDRLDGLQRVT